MLTYREGFKDLQAALVASLYEIFQSVDGYLNTAEISPNNPREVWAKVSQLVDEKYVTVATFKMEELIGSPFIYSFNTEVVQKFRQKGVGSRLQEAKQMAIEMTGAAGMVAYVAPDHEVQQQLLTKYGWKESVGNWWVWELEQ